MIIMMLNVMLMLGTILKGQERNFEVVEDFNIKPLTTFRIGGIVRYFVRVYNEEGLVRILGILNEESIPFFLLGGGSNLLVSDGVIDGLVVIKLEGTFKEVEVLRGTDDEVFVKVGAGYSLPSFSKFALDNGLSGVEFCIAIPGSFGGGLIMNAGAHGGELKDVVKRIRCITRFGEIVELSNEEAGFSYRSSKLSDYIVLSAVLSLKKGDKHRIKEKMDENLIYRANTQPKGFSAGSVFKNPPNNKAWRLIREVGLAGYRIGDVMFSDKHANFIINLGNGRSGDVISLMRIAYDRVKSNFGITLEPEIKFLGLHF
ncbi:MAG: UDP-N-acetylmuramate dehydrogenase [Spirochaetia bacterium]|nr:UDP-N-acetylmuramate dehydrogenase [Spirochaetota bacterium]MDW8112247.1 UDP-N-acetylmuramate dehydrogenase [Spirochaetia bacterium]